MPTTYTTTFKNKLIDSLTGRASTNNVITYVRPYDGTQPADPTAAPTGVSAFTTITSSISLSGVMSAPGIGVTQLAQPKGAAAQQTTGTLTFARLHDSAQAALIDVTVGTSGTPGVILDAASASTGTTLSATGFSFKMPQNNGTVYLNTDLVNNIASAFFITATAVGLCTSSVLNVYSGSIPATADTPLSGNTLLVSFTLGATAPWNTATAGSASLTSNLTATAVAGAPTTATFARIVKGAMIMQGTVGTSSADFILDTVSITSGALITLNEATISV